MTELIECPFCGGELKERNNSGIWFHVRKPGTRPCVIQYTGITEDEFDLWSTRHDDWREIETCPYDDQVLFWHESGNVAQGFIYDQSNKEFARTTKFTHWKPLPQPPKKKG